MQENNLKDWLTALVHGLVANPKSVEIEEKTDELGVLYTIKVADSDKGRVIGKEGSIADAIRVLLRSAGRTLDIRASMKVDVPNSRFEPKDR